jgi:hypothetical protein
VKLTRRKFVASTAGSALAVPLVLAGRRTEAAVPVVSPLLDAEKQRQQKRIFLIEVFVKDGKVRDSMLEGSTRKLMEALDAGPGNHR